MLNSTISVLFFIVGRGRAVPQALAGSRVLIPCLGVSRQPDARRETGQATSATTTIQVLIAALVFNVTYTLYTSTYIITSKANSRRDLPCIFVIVIYLDLPGMLRFKPIGTGCSLVPPIPIWKRTDVSLCWDVWGGGACKYLKKIISFSCL